MRVKTLKGAFLTVNRASKKILKEKIRETKVLDEENGIFYTDYSIFLVHFVKTVDKMFKKAFPEIARQIFWDEGIKISKKVIFQFARIKNNDKKKLSILFVLSNGDILQISPLSLISFCEGANLITDGGGVYYFFPTIFLTRLVGKSAKNELIAKNKLSLVAQINGLEVDELENVDELTPVSIRDFDIDWMGELLRTLKGIDMRLEAVEKQLKERKSNEKNQ
ncbi:MAG: hypothetical protein J7J57_05810 [Caldisericaceae bacterium]|nr:hypothetical protein [Caldisericaceae bacterium]